MLTAVEGSQFYYFLFYVLKSKCRFSYAASKHSYRRLNIVIDVSLTVTDIVTYCHMLIAYLHGWSTRTLMNSWYCQNDMC